MVCTRSNPQEQGDQLTHHQHRGTAIGRQASLRQAGQRLLALAGVGQDVGDAGVVGVLQDVEDQGQDGKEGGIHDKPIGAHQQTASAHLGDDVNDVPTDVDAGRRTGVGSLVAWPVHGPPPVGGEVVQEGPIQHHLRVCIGHSKRLLDPVGTGPRPSAMATFVRPWRQRTSSPGEMAWRTRSDVKRGG